MLTVLYVLLDLSNEPFLFLQTSASLKFTVLNPKGRIWTMVAGGGASVIYADTVSLNSMQTLQVSLHLLAPFHVNFGFMIKWISRRSLYLMIKCAICEVHCAIISTVPLVYQVGDLGYASELGNYAEYSGAPNEEEVLQYARVLLDVRTVEPFSCLF